MSSDPRTLHLRPAHNDDADALCDLLNATIRADNIGGLAYYTKMGFAPHSVQRGVPLSDGTPVDRVSKRFRLG